MKPKLIFMALLCTLACGTRAQTDRGQGLAGGSLSFGTSKTKGESSALNNFTVTPRIGYFLYKNFALGVEFPLSLSKLHGVDYTRWDEEGGYYEDASGPQEFNFGIAAFARKYFDIKEHWKIFGQANLTFQVISTKLIDDDGYLIRNSGRLKGIGASLSPGVAYFFNNKLGIEFSFPVVSFFHQNYYDANSSYNYPKTNNLRLALENFTPTFGIHAHF
ncbi:outer membrane beta-barrel protein [Pedobacter sp. ASV12]|uniref:outer membrane beta-barrel protein n=1 Tax=Pedobacter sp. ASV12 TaxID=2795120 RepID=UPI0018EC5BC0|nr:outer membrane beta-barrel protein [Pedobacter sp. ASV12]